MFPKRISIKLFVISFCAILLLPVTSCKTSEALRSEKKLEKEKIKAEKKRQKEYNAAIKEHYDRQTEKTKERMAQTKTRSEAYNQRKQLTFWEKLFGKKKHKKPKKKKR